MSEELQTAIDRADNSFSSKMAVVTKKTLIHDGEVLAAAVCSLRASNAALKAENEAAVKNMAALQSELAAFKNWQPSDPGTKEAMECAGSSWEYKSEDIARIAVSLGVLATSYRAAMVRLGEAEKRVKYMDEQEVGYLDTINTLEASLAELRKRMGEWRDSLVEYAYHDRTGPEEAIINKIESILASPPSPAPVESKPKEK